MADTETPTIPAELAEIIATHRALFGGFMMMADEAGGDAPAGGAEGDKPADADGADKPGDDEQLGDAGKKALAEERQARKKAERELRDAATKLQQFEDANKTEAQKIADAKTKAEQERDTYAAELATLRREQAIFRNAGNADPALLLDSRSFLDSIKELDPGDDKAIKAAIANAVRDNPRLGRIAQSTGDLGAGHQNRATAAGLNDLLRAAAGRG